MTSSNLARASQQVGQPAVGVAKQGWVATEALPRAPIPSCIPVCCINITVTLVYCEKGCKALYFSKAILCCFNVNDIPEYEGSKVN